MSSRPTIDELKPLLKSAQILCVARNGVLPWIIRHVTGGLYNHVLLIDETAGGVFITVEAHDLGGVVGLRLESYLEDDTVTRLLLRDRSPLTNDQRDAIMQVAWLHVGQKYGTLELLGIYLKLKWPSIFGSRKTVSRLDENDREICSELVGMAWLNGANIALADVAVENETPEDIVKSNMLSDVWSWSV